MKALKSLTILPDKRDLRGGYGYTDGSTDKMISVKIIHHRLGRDAGKIDKTVSLLTDHRATLPK
jgi:hypothetical protein